MRTIKLNNVSLDSKFATKFIEAWHKTTTKTQPHFISITFNSWSLWENRIGKEVDYLVDLLYQAFIIKNPITKMVIDIDKRKTDYVTLDIS